MENVKKILKSNTRLLILVAVYLFFCITTNGGIFSPLNFSALIVQNAYVYILGCGMLMCMLTGGNIDLSCGSFICFLGSVGGVMMVVMKWNVGLSIVAMLLIGIIYGCILGALIAYVNIPPWIATLVGYLAFRGIGTSILSANSTTGSIAPIPPAYLKIFSGKLFETTAKTMNIPCMVFGIVSVIIIAVLEIRSRSVKISKGYAHDSLTAMIAKIVVFGAFIMLFAYKLAYAGGIPTALIWALAIVLIYAFITEKTTIGRYFYTIGGNREATRLSGIDTKKILFLAYLNMAVLTVISAWTVVARFQAANSTAGTNFEMDAISACVVGGVSAYGGKGSVFGVVIGATLIGVINLGMSLMTIDPNYQKVIKGVVLLAAVAFDIFSARMAAKKK
ncbi:MULTISPECIES: ABC transporter permease subunit [Butyrivibrio]|jgi:putative multiple sugar transport system permease protein|uniref:ABC transporter permease subunit n=1 Tax=Butyrivibrio TaxID=830 RepID=UPI0003B409E6|nr:MULTISPECIES: sugar ABC transporter permease [Butyrivibrio]SEQ19224.1 putative multiple sugar transport system permease protein [Butyrivibrio sp. TB]